MKITILTYEHFLQSFDIFSRILSDYESTIIHCFMIRKTTGTVIAFTVL